MTTVSRFAIMLLVPLMALMLHAPASAQQDISPVTVTFYACPAGTDPTLTYESLAATCVDPSEPVLVTIGDAESWLDVQQTTGETLQQVTFAEFPSGWIMIVWPTPSQMEVEAAWCSEGEGLDYESPLIYQFTGNATGDRMFVRSPDPGQPLDCHIFHFPLSLSPVASPVASPHP